MRNLNYTLCAHIDAWYMKSEKEKARGKFIREDETGEVCANQGQVELYAWPHFSWPGAPVLLVSFVTPNDFGFLTQTIDLGNKRQLVVSKETLEFRCPTNKFLRRSLDLQRDYDRSKRHPLLDVAMKVQFAHKALPHLDASLAAQHPLRRLEEYRQGDETMSESIIRMMAKIDPIFALMQGK